MSHSCIIWASSLPTAKASISTHGSWGSYLIFVTKTILGHKHLVAVQFSSVTQSCPTLCDTMDCSMPGFPVHHQLLERPQTHVYWVGDAIQPPHPVVNFSSCLQSFPASGFFPVSQFFTSCGQSIGVSASASVLLMNIQDWFPLGLTSLISLLSKGLSRVFSTPQFKSISSLAHSFLYGPALTFTRLLEKPELWLDRTLSVMSLLFNILSRFVIAFQRASIF